jgi:hypothetical protein
MSVSGQVQKKLPTATPGRMKVQVSGSWYYASQEDLQGMELGDTVELEVKSFPAGDKTLWGVQKWRKTASGDGVHAPAPPTGSQFAKTLLPTPTGLPEGVRLTVSNWVAAAITAGAVKTELQLEEFALAARRAYHKVENWHPVDDDTGIP